MLRHSRATTYLANRKYKERDRNHVSVRSAFHDLWIKKQIEKRRRFNLKEYLKSWGM